MPFKTKSPIPFIVISVILIVVFVVMYLLTSSTEWSGHWEFTF
ncbi:hypothetical protein [Candidatus Collinsella stercoripullorum]|nr:hypothetical protein [Candidatus Collinsella stercoripullorum]